jgi:hypothetical protein
MKKLILITLLFITLHVESRNRPPQIQYHFKPLIQNPIVGVDVDWYDLIWPSIKIVAGIVIH